MPLPSGLQSLKWEVFCYSHWCSSIEMLVSLWLLSDIFFVFYFHKFYYNMLVSTSLGLSCLYFPQLLESADVCILPNLRSIQPLFLWIFSQAHFFFLGTLMNWNLDLLLLSCIPLELSIYFKNILFSPCCSDGVNSMIRPLSAPTLFSVHSHQVVFFYYFCYCIFQFC